MKIQDAVKYYGNQTKLARALGLSRAAISRWKERGDTVPLKNAVRIAKLTGGAVDLRLADYQQ